MRVITPLQSAILLLVISGCSDKTSSSAKTLAAVKIDTQPAGALAYWAGSTPADIAKYPMPIAVDSVARSAEIPRLVLVRPSGKVLGTAHNRAVEIEVLSSGSQPKIFGAQAPDGRTFFVIDTRWTNVHAKQRMDKSAMTADRTMGVGSFASGRSGASAKDSIDVDVAYKIPSLADHVYLVADGMATSLNPATEEIPGGLKIVAPFTLAKLGDTRDARLAFIAPAGAKNIALQFLDYEFGHALVPILGNAKAAAGDGTPPGKVLGKASTSKLDMAAHSLVFQPSYGGAAAPEGWRYAIVQLGGRSKAVTGKLGDIVQVDPTKYIWLEGEGGYVYPSAGGSTTAGGMLRFTPEIYQTQDVAFLVPAAADRLRLGLRADTEVARLDITDKKPSGLPRAKESFKDGSTMEVSLFGSRVEGQNIILDLGIMPLDTKGQGIDITADQQFLLITSAGEIHADMNATWNRANRPPRPFVVPPGTPVRFELSFPNNGSPTALRIRGFSSEGRIKL